MDRAGPHRLGGRVPRAGGPVARRLDAGGPAPITIAVAAGPSPVAQPTAARTPRPNRKVCRAN